MNILIVGWFLFALLILPRLTKISFARMTGFFAALDGVPPSRLDDTSSFILVPNLLIGNPLDSNL